MAYKKDVYRYGRYIEYEYKCIGKYGAKGERRTPRKKATPEQMAKQNQRNKEKVVLRKLRYNFREGDFWMTLKFPKGTRMSAKELCEIWEKFSKALRYQYKKREQVLKFIYRMELGKNGGVHIHLVVNRLECAPGTAEIVTKVWNRYGKRLHYTPLYEEGNFKDLAEYITKQPKEEEVEGQLSLFKEDDIGVFMKYGCSRNLKIPQVQHYDYTRRTMWKLVEEGPVPTKGYYIDRDSIRHGENPISGESYYYYTEIMFKEYVQKNYDSGV